MTDKKRHKPTKSVTRKTRARGQTDKICHNGETYDVVQSPDAPKGIPLDEIVSLKLNNPNLSMTQASAILGCSKANLIARLSRANISWGSMAPTLDRYKARRADLLAHKGMTVLAALSEDKVTEMTGLQLATAYGILYDKERLERGQSTANVAYQDLTQSLSEIEAEIARLQGGGVIDADSGPVLGIEDHGEDGQDAA